LYSYQGQIEELQYDVEHGKERILEWKAHILRTINQERSKNNVLDGLAAHQALIVGLGHEMASKELPRDAVRVVWEKGNTLARMCLYHQG